MECTTSGVIAEILPLKTGTKQNGQIWKNQEFILEIPGQFTSKVCFVHKDDKIDLWKLQVGEVVGVRFFVRSRFAGDRWFTDAEVFAIQRSNPRPQPAPLPSPPVDELRWE